MLTRHPRTYNIQTLMSEEQKNNDWKERELGALWVKKSLTGTQYMTGHVELKDATGKVQLVVFKNKHKYNEDGSVANDKAPDFRLYMSEVREDGNQNTNTNASAPAAPAATANATSEEIEF